ncbi:hypothetical protein N9L66_00690 [Porticoccaceae bacterium]|nr:hypothetical protein [Porticoccaceae bacterium]MDA8663464.1 hypothetical protein [Porticoccaceae bacterium]MDB2343180.1 hypothetical protein [Porticoccaceae bacterium]
MRRLKLRVKPNIASQVFVGIATCLLALTSAQAETILITSWNMNQLTHPSTIGSSRSPSEVGVLSKVGRKMGAHIIALQEIENARIARDIFGPSYAYYMTEKNPEGFRVGFAVRSNLKTVNSYQYTPLKGLSGGNMGADITVANEVGTQIRILNVHLAEGCEEQQLPSSSRDKACNTMFEQTKALSRWVSDRKREGVPFMITGTFGRYLGSEQVEPFPGLLSKVNEHYEQFVDGLRTASGDKRPACWNYRRPDFVDHFLLDPSMGQMVVAQSFRETGYGGEWSGAKQKRFSDHCPIKLMIRM